MLSGTQQTDVRYWRSGSEGEAPAKPRVTVNRYTDCGLLLPTVITVLAL